jgi:2-C-methyl-D-erythritol 4-phosphate cytidylyltransferase
MKSAAIIVAAGQGVRMGAVAKKQYMPIAGSPVLYHTMLPFDRCRMVEEIFMIIADSDQDICMKEVIERRIWQKPIHLTKGGATRQESVFNGLQATKGRFDVVVIHDGVRPLIDDEKICNTIASAYSFGAAVMAIPSNDTVKTVGEDEYVKETLERRTIRLAQTPQAFRFEIIYEAHIAAQAGQYEETDDSALVERLKIPVKFVLGSSDNIKITTHNDLILAEALIQKNDNRRNKSLSENPI